MGTLLFQQDLRGHRHTVVRAAAAAGAPARAHRSRFHGRNSPLTVVFAGCCKRSPASYPDRVIAGLADGARGLMADAGEGRGHRGHGAVCCVATEMLVARLGPPTATAWKREQRIA
jgi:hypothetical protein